LGIIRSVVPGASWLAWAAGRELATDLGTHHGGPHEPGPADPPAAARLRAGPDRAHHPPHALPQAPRRPRPRGRCPAAGRRDRPPVFSSVHRTRDAHGATRTLAVTGQGRRDPATGQVVELFGYFIDVTDSHREAAAREATASIQASAEKRAVIEQAK